MIIIVQNTLIAILNHAILIVERRASDQPDAFERKNRTLNHRTVHTEKTFRNIIGSNRIQIEFTIFRLIWNQTNVRLVSNQSENRKYNLISIWFNKISLCIWCCNFCQKPCEQLGYKNEFKTYSRGISSFPYLHTTEQILRGSLFKCPIAWGRFCLVG